MRIGIYGGSFDPVHFGHLLLAETCREQLPLERVVFVPTGIPPHKREQRVSPAEHRLAMLELATAGNPAFEISRCEIDRPDVSYTVDTLRWFAENFPDDDLFLLLGSDMFHDLPNWREPEQIVQFATPVPVRRGGHDNPDVRRLSKIVSSQQVEIVRNLMVYMPEMALSSSELRERVALGRSIRYRTPRSVEMYIQTHGLYRPGGPEDTESDAVSPAATNPNPHREASE